MKKALTSVLAMFLTTTFSPTLKAQNLVPNPSFEIYDTCPNANNQVYRAQGWSSFGNSPDYFNACAPYSSGVNVPQTTFGYQYAATGNAYCGLFTYLNSMSYREFIGCELADSLLINHKYFVSFKVAAASPGLNWGFSDKVGVLFSTVSYSEASPPSLNNFADVYSHSIISDTGNWTTVSGSFIADSNYKYIIIGNFFDNAHTDTLTSTTNGYSYIDDVCVSLDSGTCNSNGEGIEEIFSNNQVIVYPNPTERTFFIQSNLSFNIKDIAIYDALGRFARFFYKKIEDKKYLLDMIDADKGIYYIKLIYGNQNVSNKILLIN